jgi:predicted RNase H-like HicB family nuclease
MRYTASVTSEGQLFVAQCLEVDVASQGATEDEALANLREALELYLEDPPDSSHAPKIRHLQNSERKASWTSSPSRAAAGLDVEVTPLVAVVEWTSRRQESSSARSTPCACAVAL